MLSAAVMMCALRDPPQIKSLLYYLTYLFTKTEPAKELWDSNTLLWLI